MCRKWYAQHLQRLEKQGLAVPDIDERFNLTESLYRSLLMKQAIKTSDT